MGSWYQIRNKINILNQNSMGPVTEHGEEIKKIKIFIDAHMKKN